MDIWPTVLEERKSLATDLQSLTDDGWNTKSLCHEWTVRDLLAHMTATAKITPASFFPKLIASGFSFARMQAKDNARERGATPADTLANFQAIIDSKKRPPGPPQTMLGEVIIHSEDIRRALGIEHSYPTGPVTEVADFYKGSNLIIGAKRRIAGVTLRATDTDWSNGTGPEAAGPIMAIVMAMTGRKRYLDDLTGDGVEVLRGR
jgi:uncharacterized protein (TIGR03083 family)